MSLIRLSRIGGNSAKIGLVTDGRATVRWLGLTDNRYDDEISVLRDGIDMGDLPTPYLTPHPSSPVMTCRSLGGDQDERFPTKWIITAEYSSAPFGDAQQQANFLPPLDRPAIIRRRKNKYQKALDKDIDGKAILNAAKDPIDPSPEVPRGRPVIVITKNIGFIPANLSLYGDGINSTPFMCQGETFDSYSCRIDDWDLSEWKTETDANGVLWGYYTFTWSFEVNTDPPSNTIGGVYSGGWRAALLNAGYRCYRAGGSIKKFQIYDNGTPPQPIQSPALLDAQGFLLDSPSPSSATYVPFRFFYEFDFNNYPLY